MNIPEGIQIALIGLASGAIPSILQSIINRKKNKADYSDQITETAMSLIAPLKAEIAELRVMLKEKDHQIELLQSTGREKDAKINSLECRVEELQAELDRLKAERGAWKPGDQDRRGNG